MRLRAKTLLYSQQIGFKQEGEEFEARQELGLELVASGMAEELPGGIGSTLKPTRKQAAIKAGDK